jgi:hypothetical protein
MRVYWLNLTFFLTSFLPTLAISVNSS